MKTTLSRVLITTVCLAMASSATAQVLDFEDLYPGYETYTAIPSNYQGLSWNPYSWYITKYAIPGTGYEYGTIGRVSLFTAYAYDISVSYGSFDFYGAYITAAWDTTEDVVVQGWQAGTLVYSETITTGNDQAYWFDFNFTDIDTLWFIPLGNHIVIDEITFEPPYIEVDVDIKPGSFPNSVNPGNKGVIPVAILTTDDFDASTVDPASVGFGPNDAAPSHWASEDVDGDGDLDLILHFRTQTTGISQGDTEAGLIGLTVDGVPIVGTDSIRTVPNKGKK